MFKSTAFWATFGAFFGGDGDKTQPAVITMAANTRSPVAVFLGVALTLTLVSLLYQFQLRMT
jgi:putative Ca2+/H+ antiporter (TMEM165/GDT1 family)